MAQCDLDYCKTILIIEDEPIIRENLKLLLELEGYSVRTAADGEEGLRILRDIEHPCLILLDLLMPVMDGMEFLKEKAQEDVLASIPVCIVSGVAEKPDLTHIAGFIKKPIDFEGLLQFVRRFCGTPEKSGP